MAIPLPVQKYAEADSTIVVEGVVQQAVPIAWHEDDVQWVIVYADGRKIFHAKDTKKHVDDLRSANRAEKISRTDKKQDKSE